LKHIILDTDPGVDDALALILAFNSPELKVEAITTVAGNVCHSKAHRNAKQILEFMEYTSIPVCSGAEKPLVKNPGNAEDFHGKTGLGNAKLPKPRIKTDSRNAVQMIHDKVDELGKDLTLIAIGPLTNIAASIISDPSIPKRVGGLVIMGCAYNLSPYGYGNASPVSEFNIWYDPEAAKIVFNSKIPLVCAGLDVTMFPEYKMSVKMFNKIKSKNTKYSKLIVDLCTNIIDKFNGFSLHDPMAIVYVIDPSIFKTKFYKVDIETKGELTTGMTVVERRIFHNLKDGINAEIILEINAKKFHNLILKRVVGD
jgi:inosine-uridine nucleoside N-ribohydrolase